MPPTTTDHPASDPISARTASPIRRSRRSPVSKLLIDVRCGDARASEHPADRMVAHCRVSIDDRSFRTASPPPPPRIRRRRWRRQPRAGSGPRAGAPTNDEAVCALKAIRRFALRSRRPATGARHQLLWGLRTDGRRRGRPRWSVASLIRRMQRPAKDATRADPSTVGRSVSRSVAAFRRSRPDCRALGLHRGPAGGYN